MFHNFAGAVCAYCIDTECYNNLSRQTTIKFTEPIFSGILFCYIACEATGPHRPRPARQRHVSNQNKSADWSNVWRAVSRREIAPEAIGRGTARVSRRNK